MIGLLVVDKPEGLTSFDVVARVRKLTREKRIGHAGTLDPLATGVLPLALGKATRVVEYLSAAGKEYHAIVRFGATSATYDREGPITETPGAKLPTRQELEAALAHFRGPIQQQPPMHSAVKQQGKRLYELARAGIEVERPTREVTIYNLELLSYQEPLVELLVGCSKGTYIRSLAHDLGAVLGCGAYLEALRRTKHGPFTLDQASTLEELAAASENNSIDNLLLPLDLALEALPRIDLNEEQAQAIRFGQRLDLSPLDNHNTARAYGPAGVFLAIIGWQADQQNWKPEKVFLEDGDSN